MDTNYLVLLPEIAVALTGILVVALTPFSDGRNSRLTGIALAGLALAAALAIWQWDVHAEGFFGMVQVDGFAMVARLLFFFATAAVAVISSRYLDRQNLAAGEFLALLLFSAIGMCLMASSADLIMTFLGIEILSIATYVLAGYRITSRSVEAAWKYFILGAFSTAFLLYGVALVYGSTGSTRYLEIGNAIGEMDSVSAMLLIGAGLMLVGFAFKAAMVPFHIWAPDVYEGSPVPITAHLAVSSKAAAILALLRVLHEVFPGISNEWQILLWVSAVMTMALGNIAALAQSNIKRMLAYSSIAHAGYLLVGLTSNNDTGTTAVLFYLVSYAMMTLGAFAVIQMIAGDQETSVNLTDYAGIGHKNPFLCICLSVFLLSMAGIPSTAGFMGKLFLFSSAVRGQFYWLVVIGLLASAVGVYYYLRVIVLMFMKKPVEGTSRVELPGGVYVLILILVIGTLWLGVLPGSVLELVSEASTF